jgi:2-haloacid dehalogenase
VDTILGGFRPFSEHIESALRAIVRDRRLESAPIEEALEVAAVLPAFGEVGPALEQLTGAGHSLAVLTNSGEESGHRTLEAAGLAECFARILGVDAVGAFKPHPSTYRYALGELASAAAAVTFVSAHGWDLAGAAHAGMRTALVRRGSGVPPALPPPSIEVGDLAELAVALSV